MVGGVSLGLYDFHARYYNPVLGRWFNMDPALQTTNPYLYCGNSPMLYVDKDGKWFWAPIIFAAVSAGGMNLTMNMGNVDNFWQGLGYWGIGAAAGAAGALTGGSVAQAIGGIKAIGAGMIGGAISGAAGGAAGGFVGGAGNAWMGGASFGRGLTSGLKGALNGAATRALSGAVFGGLDALADGRNILNGIGSEADISYVKLPYDDPDWRYVSDKVLHTRLSMEYPDFEYNPNEFGVGSANPDYKLRSDGLFDTKGGIAGGYFEYNKAGYCKAVVSPAVTITRDVPAFRATAGT